MDMQVPNNPGNRVVSLASVSSRFEASLLFGTVLGLFSSNHNNDAHEPCPIHRRVDLAGFAFGHVGAKDKTEGDDKSNRTTQLIRESWQHVAFHAITELQDQEIPQTLENQTFGFGLTYMKHDRSGLFDGGLDLGVQPFGTRTLSETLWSEIEEDSVQADVTLRSNMVRAHYVLRTTLFKNRGFQPYAELFGGIRGAMVTSAFALDDGNKLPGQLSHTSLNFTLATPLVRLRLTKGRS